MVFVEACSHVAHKTRSHLGAGVVALAVLETFERFWSRMRLTVIVFGCLGL